VTPLRLTLKAQNLKGIRYRLNIEEPRVIRRAKLLNCLHLGCTPVQIHRFAQWRGIRDLLVRASAPLPRG
jgi:hypothetical protein